VVLGGSLLAPLVHNTTGNIHTKEKLRCFPPLFVFRYYISFMYLRGKKLRETL